MPVKWNQDYNPEQVINRINSSRKIGFYSKGIFKEFTFKELETIIYSMLIFSSDIPEIDARDMIPNAIINSVRKGVLTPNNLLAEVNKLEREYQSVPIKRYALASSISMSPNLVLPKIKLENNFSTVQMR